MKGISVLEMLTSDQKSKVEHVIKRIENILKDRKGRYYKWGAGLVSNIYGDYSNIEIRAIENLLKCGGWDALLRRDTSAEGYPYPMLSITIGLGFEEKEKANEEKAFLEEHTLKHAAQSTGTPPPFPKPAFVPRVYVGTKPGDFGNLNSVWVEGEDNMYTCQNTKRQAKIGPLTQHQIDSDVFNGFLKQLK